METNLKCLIVTNTVVEKIFDSLLEWQKNLTDEQRLEFWKVLQDGYCTHCGRECITECHCTNDE